MARRNVSLRAGSMAFLSLALVFGSCSDQRGKNEDPPKENFVPKGKFDEGRMDAAIQEAKSKLDTFVGSLEAKKPGAEMFMLKKGFPTAKGELEFLWIKDIAIVGDGFTGSVDNAPVNEIGIKVGDTVKIARAEVADWMFLEAGRLKGGYTIAAIAYGTPRQKVAEESWGIDWGQYDFLKND